MKQGFYIFTHNYTGYQYLGYFDPTVSKDHYVVLANVEQDILIPDIGYNNMSSVTSTLSIDYDLWIEALAAFVEVINKPFKKELEKSRLTTRLLELEQEKRELGKKLKELES